MMMQLLKRIHNGIAWGGIVTFIALTFLMINDINPAVSTIWISMFASMIFGIYFGLASFIFVLQHWSPLKQTAVHFSLSIIVYYSIAFPLGWVPFNIRAILFVTLIFILIYALFWTGYTIYYKKIEASLNKSLPKK